MKLLPVLYCNSTVKSFTSADIDQERFNTMRSETQLWCRPQLLAGGGPEELKRTGGERRAAFHW